MATVYILLSEKLDKFYVGSCLEFDSRLEKHVQKFYPRSYTSRVDDWQVYLLIPDLTYEQARAIELHIKRMKSRTYITNLVKYPQIVERLREKYK